MTTDTKTKLQELLRGERDWDKLDMARECLNRINEVEAWLSFYEGMAADENLT